MDDDKVLTAIAALRTDLRAEINAIRTETLGGLSARLDAFGGHLSEQAAQFTEMLTEMLPRIKSISIMVDSLHADMDEVKDRLARVEDRLDTLHLDKVRH